MLTFERGVEDYTLACGTGTGSVACVLQKLGRLPGGSLTAHNPGGTLTVKLREEAGAVSELYLEGPAEMGTVYDF